MKALNRPATCSGVMPMPVSTTRNRMSGPPRVLVHTRTATVTARLGELEGVSYEVGEDLLEAQRVAVDRLRDRRLVDQVEADALDGALTCMSAHILQQVRGRPRSRCSMFIFPASIFDRSGMSLMIEQVLALRDGVDTDPLARLVQGPSPQEVGPDPGSPSSACGSRGSCLRELALGLVGGLRGLTPARRAAR